MSVLDRDRTGCVCGHPCVSHGYGTVVMDGSRIGTGPCGKCACDAFAPVAS